MAQSSPNMPSKHNVALKKISPSHEGLSHPDSPTKEAATSQRIVEDLQHLFGMFLEKALLDLTSGEPPNTPVSQDQSPSGPDMVRLKKLLVKLTRDEYASAELSVVTKPALSCPASNEQEDAQVAAAIDLKIAEPEETSSGLDDYAEYAFVVRERVERNSEEVAPYIDIKPEGLRDILRVVLRDIKAISLMEDKPSIEQTVPFHFLPELDRCVENTDNGSDHDSAHIEHLRLLIDHLKQAYASTSQRLESMLQHGHIAYDLLWALFKPDCHACTTCIGTKEPRCVKFDAGEEVTQNDETWFNLKCRFLDYDGVKFGGAGIFLRVPKFRGPKPIATLEAYPLCHHPSHEQVRKDSVERGQKCRDLASSHPRHCTGSAFSMNKGMAVKPPTEDRHYLDLDTGVMVLLRCNVHSASHDSPSSFGSDQLRNIDSRPMETLPMSGSPCLSHQLLPIENIQYFDLDTGEMNTGSVVLAH